MHTLRVCCYTYHLTSGMQVLETALKSRVALSKDLSIQVQLFHDTRDNVSHSYCRDNNNRKTILRTYIGTTDDQFFIQLSSLFSLLQIIHRIQVDSTVEK